MRYENRDMFIYRVFQDICSTYIDFACNFAHKKLAKLNVYSLMSFSIKKHHHRSPGSIRILLLCDPPKSFRPKGAADKSVI